jgi:hypothetical protein
MLRHWGAVAGLAVGAGVVAWALLRGRRRGFIAGGDGESWDAVGSGERMPEEQEPPAAGAVPAASPAGEGASPGY